ncbi:ATP-binding protein [Bacillus sp. NPDC094077]|uniref:ATP-binding protein n=1 Tax=Bacillus sp. NPDC094077 TaxID=3390932 RepID=UPI003CFC716B
MTKNSINLMSLINAKKDLSQNTFETYLKKFEVSIKSSEFEDITKLVEGIKSTTKKRIIFSNYYVGFTIKQIGKEFDLLRFGTNYHINIELKRTSTKEKILKQLIKNKYYLNSLETDALNFTYVSSEDKLYFLEEDDSLVESDFKFLVGKIAHQDILEFDDVNQLFDPSNYLISPFNSTEKFINNQYFLTQQQESIKGQLSKLYSSSQSKLFAIEGSAGTGKTLLVYDIAKQYINAGKNVSLIHCGNLNVGHSKLIYNHSWNIRPIKKYEKLLLEQTDLIIVDESQRIRKDQLEEIIEYANNNQVTCIFSLDPKQCLKKEEIRNKIHEDLYRIVDKKFDLTKKIRTNPEISAFIKNLFSRSDRTSRQNYENIEIQYFSNIDEAKSFVTSLKFKGWISINYTTKIYGADSINRMNVHADENAHSVIGQEFDNVIAVIGDSFYYNSDGKLVGDRNAFYPPTKMLYQILTRTRKKLCLVIVDNEEILKECLELLGGSTPATTS